MQLRYISGKEFNDWNGHALVTSLKDRSLRKLIFKDIDVKEDIIFKDKIGRIRDIKIHKDTGKIFFLTERFSLELKIVNSCNHRATRNLYDEIFGAT